MPVFAQPGPRPKAFAASGSLSHPSPSRNQLPIQRKPLSHSAENLPSAASYTGGLPGGVRELMERRLGTSLADVRVHADHAAGRRALDLSAQAYATGRDIYFAPGHYQPHTPRGLGLLAHELTHVVQQKSGQFASANQGSTPARSRRALEAEADQVASSVQSSGGMPPVSGVARFGEPQFSVMESLSAMRAAVRGGLEGAADWVASHAEGAAGGVIHRLNSLRQRLRGLEYVRLPREVVLEMETLYNDLRSDAPSWLPIPSIAFSARPVQQVAIADDIAVGAVILLIAFIMVMWWLIGQGIPSIRHSREQAMRRIIDEIEDALRPSPAPPPTIAPPPSVPTPVGTSTAPPIAPPIVPQVLPRSRDRDRSDPRVEPRVTTKDQTPDMNAMRFQVQWNTRNNGPTFALAAYASPNPGVTTVQALATLATVMMTVTPKRAQEAAAPAAAKQMRWISGRPPAGVAGQLSHSEYFQYQGYTDARVDVENLRGHNLKV